MIIIRRDVQEFLFRNFLKYLAGVALAQTLTDIGSYLFLIFIVLHFSGLFCDPRFCSVI